MGGHPRSVFLRQLAAALEQDLDRFGRPCRRDDIDFPGAELPFEDLILQVFRQGRFLG